MKAKTFADFQICISAPLIHNVSMLMIFMGNWFLGVGIKLLTTELHIFLYYELVLEKYY